MDFTDDDISSPWAMPDSRENTAYAPHCFSGINNHVSIAGGVSVAPACLLGHLCCFQLKLS